MRGKILQDLQTWFDSLQELVPSDFCKMTTTSSEAPIVAYYALHLYHCLHVLVYGKMDLINMYHDTEWQASADFVKAGENAMTCAIVMIFPPIVRRSWLSNIARCILQKDPRLHILYRLFGTYFLQASFIFMILAKKLRADPLILDNCSSNLNALDVVAKRSNIKYRRDFANVLRKIMSDRISSSNDASQLNIFEPELKQYRWTGGHSVLWTSDT